MQKIGFINQLQIIYKLVDTCNLSCTYCYYFNGDSYTGHENRPNYAPLSTSEKLAHRISELNERYDIHNLSIVLHGGEPLMMNKNQFKKHIELLRKKLGEIEINLQTNGILFSKKWCEIINDCDITVGVSLDGPKELNDTNRITASGKGTYYKTIEGLNIARKYLNQDRIGTISVINHKFDYEYICNHFSNKLNLFEIALLVPDRTNNIALTKNEHLGYTKALIDAFNFHVNNPKVNIREINSLLDNFQKYEINNLDMYCNEHYIENNIIGNEVITIHTNGDINYYDLVYPEIMLNKFNLVNRSQNIQDISLDNFMFSDEIKIARDASKEIASCCKECKYSHLCYQNAPSYRATSEGYNSKSVYCEVYVDFYNFVLNWLISNGYPKELLFSSFKS